MRILFVSPKINSLDDCTPGWLRIPQLALSILASLTPPEHEVRLVEEEDEAIPVDEHWDVVGLSTMTSTAPRAYELATMFRQNGAKVILGGIHPSVLPEEAMQFADAVVIGEAECIWNEVLHDVQHNQLKKIYRNWQPDISDSPPPLREKRHRKFSFIPYIMPIMFSRGCPNNCEFCCVHKVYGRRQRFIPVEKIVKDIENTGARRVLFLDDNIGGRRLYAKKLFEAITPLKLRWSGQASAQFILDDELYNAALRSGLEALFIGVESVEANVLRNIPKSLSSVALYERAIKRCRATGVLFVASLIFGLDEQTPHVFERTLDFLLRNSVPTISPNVLTPYPGTMLFERLKREGRILHTNWSYYDHRTVCYRPKNMEPEELAEKYLEFRENFFSLSSIIKRSWMQIRVNPLVYLGFNYACRKTTKFYRQHSRDYFTWLRRHRKLTETQPMAHCLATNYYSNEERREVEIK
ncbi:MAG: radical SAM protein [Planctomycetota bacterium]